ncbi:MAG: tRNA lysidine(34) synthetase TilS, partial [Ruminococcaceae bacterium]|nr:tRNA lysidine(34) synthetase TilS [Oscillospiraceae bacterium]
MSKCDIIPKDAKAILCAVSGGADSVYLLHRATAEAKINDVTVHVAHYNHNLRGKESDRDESFVKNLCRDLGVNLICESGDVALYSKQNKIGTEEAARELRYDFLARVAKSVKADYILTAHTADDNAETILLN